MSHNFPNDVGEIAKQLVAAFDLTFSEDEPGLQDQLFRWLDFRLRYIDERPRSILKSNDFDTRAPAQALSALSTFIGKAQRGENLNAFQSKTDNDASALSRGF